MGRLSLLFLVTVFLACSPADRPTEDRPMPARISLDQFQALRWLQGTWRGSEAGAHFFFESYAFLDDSTIKSFSYPDSTFALADDSSLIALRNGEVTSSEGSATWILTGLDSTGVRFKPLRNAKNSFVWTLESRSAWAARLSWRDSTGTVQERTYQMERIGS
jgi:hypothetical protein